MEYEYIALMMQGEYDRVMASRRKSGDPAIAARIKNLRRIEGWSQETLAEKLQVSYSFITKIETAQLGLGKETLEKLADIFRVSQSFILFGETAPPRSIQLPPGLTDEDVRALQGMARHIANIRQARRPQTRQELRSEAFSDMDFLEKIDTIGEDDDPTDKNKPA